MHLSENRCQQARRVARGPRSVVPSAGRKRHGAAVVEFAFVAPLFFMVVLGIIELARGYMAVHLLTNAARIGCRTGVVPGTSTNAIQTAVNNNLTAVGISGATTTVQVNGVTVEAANAVAEDRITVILSVPVNQVTWVPGGTYLSGNLSGRFTMRRE